MSIDDDVRPGEPVEYAQLRSAMQWAFMREPDPGAAVARQQELLAAYVLRERGYHVIQRLDRYSPGSSYDGVLDNAVASARYACWQTRDHGASYGECCVAAAVQVALDQALEPIRVLLAAAADGQLAADDAVATLLEQLPAPAAGAST